MINPESLTPENIQLVLEHARLTAQHAAGDESVIERIKALEAKLELDPSQIADIAVGNYMRDY